jgi:hypothetical protein
MNVDNRVKSINVFFFFVPSFTTYHPPIMFTLAAAK